MKVKLEFDTNNEKEKLELKEISSNKFLRKSFNEVQDIIENMRHIDDNNIDLDFLRHDFSRLRISYLLPSDDRLLVNNSERSYWLDGFKACYYYLKTNAMELAAEDTEL